MQRTVALNSSVKRFEEATFWKRHKVNCLERRAQKNKNNDPKDVWKSLTQWGILQVTTESNGASTRVSCKQLPLSALRIYAIIAAADESIKVTGDPIRVN